MQVRGKAQVLIACSDAEGRRVLSRALAECGLKAVLAPSVAGARSILARGNVAMVFCAAELDDGRFKDVLQAARQSGSAVPVIVASRSDDTRQYLEAMQSGAFDYVATPCHRSEVERIVSNALRRVVAA